MPRGKRRHRDNRLQASRPAAPTAVSGKARAAVPLWPWWLLDPHSDRGSATFYIVLPALPDFPAVAAASGLPEETIRQAVPIKRFGYYDLYRLEAG